MSKELRLHIGPEFRGFNSSTPLTNNLIKDIQDPNGATIRHEITSIPTPFARFEIVNIAFSEVLKSGLNKDFTKVSPTIYELMVSESLDIAELFFRFKNYEQHISIVEFNPKAEFENALSINKVLSDSLSLYFNQDSKNFNFDMSNRFYFLNYKNGIEGAKVIGGTSPLTMFFSSQNNFYNDIRTPQDHFNFISNGRKLFSTDDITHLHKRDIEFINFYIGLFESNPNRARFSTIEEYINQVKNNLSLEDRSSINNAKDNYTSLPDLMLGGLNVEILGHPVKQAPDVSDKIEGASGFVIQSTKDIEGKKPLVLPNDTFNQQIKYVGSNWKDTDKAPNIDERPINQRTLPFDNSSYPYLTISDFLEPVIVKTIDPINEKEFYNGGFPNNDDTYFGYLLPIKDEFFKYFDASFLSQTIAGNKVLEIKPVANDNVQVILRIPIQNDKFITYSRIYNKPTSDGNAPQYDEKNNKGAIFENAINIAITPMVKFPDVIHKEFNIMLIERNNSALLENEAYNLSFYKNGVEVSAVKVQRTWKSEQAFNAIVYKINDNFDNIRVSNKYGTNIVLPKYKDITTGVNQMTVAIDFGTTNTHIEYTINNGIPQPLELNSSNSLLSYLCNSRIDSPFFEDYLYPKEINANSNYKFPQRTVLAHHQNYQFTDPKFSLGVANIPFHYNKKKILFSKLKSNIKWDVTNPHNTQMITLFFENLLKLIRIKAIEENANFSMLNIVWFYPSSMPNFQKTQMGGIWNGLISNYFGAEASVSNIAESFAPFYYYRNVQGKAAMAKPIVCIDIGGGTTDVVVFTNNQPTLMTSFKFAGDAIFGDNYNRNIHINGYKVKFDSIIKNKIIELNIPELNDNLLDYFNAPTSSDLNNFFFSLFNNKDLKKNGININLLGELITNNEFKIIFVLFYHSIVYHIIRLLISKNIEIPSEFIFTGTASKLITILGDKSLISSFNSRILNSLNEKFKDTRISIIQDENPKEISVKGGTKVGTLNINPRDINLISIDGGTEKISKIADDNAIKYKDINQYTESTLEEFGAFMTSVLSFGNYYRENFGIDPNIFNASIDFIKSNAENALLTGIDIKKSEIGNLADSEPISETLFFYPLIGTLGELAYKISQNEIK